MNLNKMKYLIVSLMILVSTKQAYAEGTLAGTSVSNSATVNYEVGGIAQTPVVSSATDFVVDRRINLTVAESGGGYTSVLPGATSQALKFTVTNSTNDTMDFRLDYTQDASGAAGPFGGTDSFDTSSVQFYLDDGDGIFDGGDTLITFLDNVAADAVVTVFVVSIIPSGPVDGDISSGTLTAIASTDGAGGPANDYTETPGADDPSAVDTVFGDDAGDTDGTEDGQHSDDDGYEITTAVLSVVKTQTVISDPFNGVTDPKAIPGAVVEYCITITNTGSSEATVVTITDTIPPTTTFVADSIIAGGTTCTTGGTTEDDNTTGTDDILSPTENTGSFSGGTVTTSVQSVGIGGTTISRFQVTIN